jgi:hypothetical protein
MEYVTRNATMQLLASIKATAWSAQASLRRSACSVYRTATRAWSETWLVMISATLRNTIMTEETATYARLALKWSMALARSSVLKRLSEMESVTLNAITVNTPMTVVTA